MKEINIGLEFSNAPLGRYHPSDGPHSGERFRVEFLVPALRANDQVVVKIDDAEGYGSSFLEEAFGGLVRCEGFTAPFLHEHLSIVFTKNDYRFFHDAIWRYIDRAKKRD